MNDLDLSILKTLLTNRKYALEFAHDCNEKLFDTNVWRFAKIILEYIRLYKNTPTKRVIIERIDPSKNKALAEHIEQVFDKVMAFPYDDKEYKHDLEKIKKRYSEKLILDLKNSLSVESERIDLKKSVGDIQSALNNIRNINQVKAYEQNTMRGAADAFKNRYMAKLKDPTFGMGIQTGYSFFDFATSGLLPSEFLIIGAETGGGKSMLLMNMAINMWLQGNSIDMEKDFIEGTDILYFSLEMPFESMQERVLSRLGMIPQKSIRDAKLTDEEQKKLTKCLKFVKQYPYDFEIVDVPRGATIESMELIFNDIVLTRRKPKVMVVDYLSLMDYKDDSLDDWLKLGKISEQLSEFARVHEIVMLSAVQLNDPQQGKKGNENQIGMHRIGRSRQILHNANMAIQIEKRPPEEPDLNLHMIKSRRTELTKGKAFKNYACCALLNDNYISSDQKNNPDDISDRINKKE